MTVSVSGWGTRAAGALTGLVLLVGCREAAPDAAGGTAAVASPVRPTGYGAVFLDVGECSSFGRTSFTEVSCRSERAAARVVARHDGTTRDGPPCPPATDFVLHISERWPAADEDGDGMVPRGHACMRNLQPPHPGDPGGGGGPRTVVGDCVYALAGGKVRETACDGSGPRRPEFKVTKAVDARSECPASTALYVRLGGPSPVGCAVPV
ncbi:hypothetical protein [Streptomyces griseorubens]|uniref:hypothetical protein n=1 Tax=Streptomyces TaxID=1883 RepID=UPI00068F7F10|nr:hypothetical protein [Streptomyces griseorubens]ALV50301.1 hypothetical protein ASR50_13385 [Streptomyces sp. 4F]